MGAKNQWNLATPLSEEDRSRFPELPDLTVQLVVNRGFTTQEDVDRFLLPDYGQDQHDPFLFRDMQKAVDRIAQALEQQEHVVIHGDYDADGVCATAVLYTTLKKLGIEQVGLYLPHRDTEGYGLNMNTVQKLKDQGVDLIITVDCGISNAPEVTAATEAGIDVIVTDHHSEPPTLPSDAIAILNPKLEAETYPFKFLAGVGVSFKLSQALITTYELGEAFEKWLLDLVAISTVTDFVELIGENRVFLRYGLVVLQRNRRPGLRALFDAMDVDPATADEETIGFQVGPHINAAGRMNHANAALELMIEEEPAKAAQLALDLRRTNKQRQSQSRKMVKEAKVLAEQQQDEMVLIVESQDWPVGLVGLVAGSVTGEFARPAFVITTMGDEIVGSGRSIEHFNLVEALQSMDELFTKYGGHPMACGFSLPNKEALEEFKKRMRARATEHLAGKDLRKTLQIEADISLEEVNWELIDTLKQFGPYGQANPRPLFLSSAVQITDMGFIGKQKNHVRMSVTQNGTTRKCIGFKWAAHVHENDITQGDTINLVYRAGVNEWNGNREIQLQIEDIEKIEV